MKKFTLIAAIVLGFATASNAQTQKDWYLIGGQIGNLGLGFQKNNTNFSFNVSPRVAWFLRDNLAVGAEVNLGLTTAKGATGFTYGIGPIARYYFRGNALDAVSKTRFLIEANVGFAGSNVKTSGNPGITTNGVGFGFGPGLAYFINQNIALEGLLKYNYASGFGNSNSNSLGLAVGFQIHLPKAKLKAMKNDVK